MLALEVNIVSERGGRNYNEDACGHWQSEDRLCCVLADGAGGHGGGDVAARLAVQELLRVFGEQPADAGERLETMVREVNRTVIERRAPGPTRDMHSTVVCLVLDAAGHTAHWAHAGDSRLYWFRDGGLLQRSHDHSVVQSLVDAGLWRAEDLKGHPKGNELISALGMPPDELKVSVSTPPCEPRAGDAFLLCTDGWWEHLDDAALEQSLRAADTPKDWLADQQARIQLATRELKNHDNFTAIAVWVSATPGLPSAAPHEQGA